MYHPIVTAILGFWIADYVGLLLLAPFIGMETTIETALGTIPFSLVRLFSMVWMGASPVGEMFWEAVAVAKRRGRLSCGIRGFLIGALDFVVHVITIGSLYWLGVPGVVGCVVVTVVTIAMMWACFWLFKWESTA